MRSDVPLDRGFSQLRVLLALLLAVLAAPAAQAQPFDAWMTLAGSPNVGYIRIPHSAALNPTNAFTFEAWVAIRNSPPAEDCRSIAGKNFLQSWWIGVCTVGGQPTLRSYLKGGVSRQNGGIIPANVWTHIAVVFTGTQRRHYINGELAAEFPEAAPLTTSGSEMRIGSDVSWDPQPQGAIDEVRLWNVARTTAQIRAFLNERVHTPQPGLVGVWPLDGNPLDVVGPHDGTAVGTGARHPDLPGRPRLRAPRPRSSVCATASASPPGTAPAGLRDRRPPATPPWPSAASSPASSRSSAPPTGRSWSRRSTAAA